MALLMKSYDRSSVNREDNIASDQIMAEELLRRKNKADSKITDKILKISIILNFIIIFFNVYLLVMSRRLLYSNIVETNDGNHHLEISLRYFIIMRENNNTHENNISRLNLFCLNGSKCEVVNTCQERYNITFNDINEDYHLDCNQFVFFKISSIIVNYFNYIK